MVKNEKQVLDKQFTIVVNSSNEYLFPMAEECIVYSTNQFELARIVTIDKSSTSIKLWNIKKILYLMILKRKYSKLGYRMDRQDKGSSLILSFYREEWDKWIRGYLV